MLGASISDPDERSARRTTSALSITLLILVYAVVVIRTAWVMDDAYISFRSVDNVIHGYGLRWNTFERVEAFTNPLWTLVLCAFSLITREVFYTGLFLQIAISVAAVHCVARASRSVLVACGCIAALTLSKAFVDYSTSGLENPLSHLLVALFAARYLSGNDRSPRALRSLTVVASLAFVNRLDLFWLLAPCLAEATVEVWNAAPRSERNRAVIRSLAVGLLPFLAWELFSLFYYGALIPNSALAKLTSHAPRGTLLVFGASLLRNALVVDPLTVVCIVAALVLAFVERTRRSRVLACGIVLTLAYVVWVGGDHMSGRFFSVPLLASVMLLGQMRASLARSIAGAAAFAGGAAAWMAGFPTLGEQFTAQRPAVLDDIEDYQREWHPKTGLLTRGPLSRGPNDDWVNLGKSAREHPDQVPIWGGMGLTGYYAGPAVRIIDQYGLTDPLLARLPMPDAKHETYFKIGHFQRGIPEGYQETVRQQRNLIRHPALAAYYDKLALVTQGPLWSALRLFETIKLNLGLYDSLLTEYMAFEDPKPINAASLPPARAKNDGDPMHNCPSWWVPCAPVGATFASAGIRVKLGGPSHAAALDLQLTPGPYVLVLWSGYVELTRMAIEAKSARTRVALGSVTREAGFDGASLLPAAGDDARSLTYFEAVATQP